MDNITSKNGDFDADLENGGVSESDEVDSKEGILFGTLATRQLNPDPNSRGGLITAVGSSCVDGSENVKFVVIEKRTIKENPKSLSVKKPPKPPRPPRGLSLDSADQKLITVLHELVKLKRARIERMKALKKAKEAKAAYSKNQLFATLLTVLFCIVLLLQGISSRTNSAVNLQGSPTSTKVTEGSIIYVKHHHISSTPHVNEPGSEPLRILERVSGLKTKEKVSRAVG